MNLLSAVTSLVAISSSSCLWEKRDLWKSACAFQNNLLRGALGLSNGDLMKAPLSFRSQLESHCDQTKCDRIYLQSIFSRKLNGYEIVKTFNKQSEGKDEETSSSYVLVRDTYIVKFRITCNDFWKDKGNFWKFTLYFSC